MTWNEFQLGYEEAGDGPLLLLVHGFPHDRTMWADQLRALSDIRRVVAPDLRGRGLSPHPSDGGWTMDTHADDLARLLDALGADEADLGGLSMGGYVTFAFLRRHGDRIRSLALMSTRAAADTPEAKVARERSAALAREKGTGALAGSLIPKLLAPGSSAASRARLQAMLSATPAETAAADLLAMRDRPDATSELASIEVATLVIHGDQDAIVPVGEARAMASAIPGAQFVAITGCGHMAPMENPDAANTALRSFLER